ncbi:UNVERIFIED_CONTAM: hypothetical protein Sradi_6110200 [Sesamum radiatum]|uniref:Secreted protein n=1 Tax=Sesamum radiatum TaxID=300843 RepID=A0AAW2KJD4_SESRA
MVVLVVVVVVQRTGWGYVTTDDEAVDRPTCDMFCPATDVLVVGGPLVSSKMLEPTLCSGGGMEGPRPHSVLGGGGPPLVMDL